MPPEPNGEDHEAHPDPLQDQARRADRNAELISAVFSELKAAKPDGVRYLSLRLDDDTFIHFVETAAEDGSSPIPEAHGVPAFQSGIRERCAEPPQSPPRPLSATIACWARLNWR